jgi:hypothetical protein
MQHIEFTIIQSSIDNGRIYFDQAHKSFFPSDVIGGRGASERAMGQISIDADGECFDTDIRLSSSVRISPRTSFKRWLASVRAHDGAKVRLHRVADRQYKLEYLG